jgi:GrpB-like predicted nucleotidyltransferase (UPF0157 family)/GNAT superfamily N-acetyltransferase
MDLSLRPATSADRDFARRVYVATTRPYVDHLPDWTEAYIAARFERRFVVATSRMIERNGVTVGWVRMSDSADGIVLEQLYIDPACHKQGVGSAIMTMLAREWHLSGRQVSLRTLRRNPARRLYERFGFRVVDDSEPNSIGMCRSPASLPPPHAASLHAYDPNWPRQAEMEATRLQVALGANLLTVEHFGSTSVPGLAAKPVLDLMPIVADLAALDAQRPAVERLGYAWHGEFELPGRRFCTRSRDDGVRLVHLHFYQQGSPQIARHLAFRDYLRAHPAAACDYEQEKRRASALHPNDSLAYNIEKAAWVTGAEARALAWWTASQT